MKAIVLAGGKGTRLWPLSREDCPKQLLGIGQEKSYLQRTISLLEEKISYRDIHVVTGYSMYWDVCHQLSEIGPVLRDNILMEPCGRDTAPAILLAYLQMVEDHSITDDDVIFITPSDHCIQIPSAFHQALQQAEATAKKGWIVLLGIHPSTPETGYGYLKIGKELENGLLKVDEFTEKPDLEVAKTYLESGKYLWNAGMVCISARVLREAFAQHLPHLAKFLKMPLYQAMQSFNTAEKVSFDYGILERSDQVAAIATEMGWSDVGGWDAVSDLLPKDELGNASVGTSVLINTENSTVIADQRTVAVIDGSDLIVVDTDDALLITKKGSSGKVKRVVHDLKEQNSSLVTHPKTLYRPWGFYKIVAEAELHQVRNIHLLPEKEISSQTHRDRSEHWVVLSGTVTAVIDGKKISLHPGSGIHIPPGTQHSLYNEQSTEAIILETQVFFTPNFTPSL